MQYVIDIGLEVHVELSTNTKMFCGCQVVDPTKAEPNSSVCPVCLGMPGVLPVVNKKAVAYAVKAGLALNCKIAERSIFARKNYFYPDLPKGYQISQYEDPIAYDGWICVNTSQGEKKITIRRAHLEEDTGKLNHINTDDENYSLVDLNRAGIPLLEIVTEPDMHTIEEVHAYSHELRLLLRYLEVTSGDMEKGAMRFEANVSMRSDQNAPMGKRVEIKNLNSIAAMEKAISYEMKRQQKILDKGGKVKQETLGWSEAQNKTFSQRSKEEAHDYRYFPEPDLPPLIVERSWIKEINAEIPELPSQKRKRYQEDYKLPLEKVEPLIQDKEISAFFEDCISTSNGTSAEQVANWILSDVFAWLNESKQSISELKISPQNLAELIGFQQKNTINKKTAKDVLHWMLESGKTASEIIEDKGLQQISDDSIIQELVHTVLEKNPKEVKQYLAGKDTLFDWLFGQVMRSAQGKGDPTIIRKTLQKYLDTLKE